MVHRPPAGLLVLPFGRGTVTASQSVHSTLLGPEGAGLCGPATLGRFTAALLRLRNHEQQPQVMN